MEMVEDKIEEMKILISQLNAADEAYYKYDKPVISDKEYDSLYDLLAMIEKQTGIILAGSPTNKVQGYILDGFQKVKHSKPMLSAAKTKDINEIKKFVGSYDWYCSGKLDGLTLVCIFEDGKFVQGITRGNGIEGEDVTAACKFIKNLPMQIPYKERLELRGECVMSWNEFNRINENLAVKYSHPRNLAAGTLRQLDLNVVKERELSYVVFECVTPIKESKLQELHWLADIGFETVIRMGQDIGNVDKVSELMTQEVKADKYPYDGLIFEIDSNTVSAKLGRTGHHECAREALKWSDTTYETVLRGVEWQVGKTGALCPVAVFDEVDLDGALTTRATLHNLSYVKDLQLGIGDVITVYRSNLVIPKVDDNLTRSNTLKIPSACPICGSPTNVVKDNDTEILVCMNNSCPGRMLGLWKAFVARKAMNVDGLSESTLEKLLQKRYLTNMFVSLYELNEYKHELYNMDGLGAKSVDNLFAAIEASKDVDLEHFITAFSIPGIGTGQSKLLAARFKTFDEFAKACDDQFDFSKIPGIGKVLTTNIWQWWVNNHVQMLDVAAVVRFKDVQKPGGGSLDGKNFVITGTVNHHKNRDEIKAKIESLGGKVSGSVSKNTDYLINNDVNSASGKNKKAKELGIPIISEEMFLNMIK